MRRIRYVSEFATPLSPAEVDEIALVSAENNARDGITGLLVASGNLFFQLLEGPDEAVEALLRRILGDRRHRNVMLLGDEHGDLRRQCPDWAMKKVDLSLESTVRSEPLRAVLEAATIQYRLLNELVATLERALLRELIAAEAEDLGRFAAERGLRDETPGGV